MAQDTIEQTFRDCGYHCRGEVAPTHLCAVVGVPIHPDHDRARGGHAGRLKPVSGAAYLHASESAHADMVHMALEVGHSAGMSMDDRVRAMRRRFWVTILLGAAMTSYSATVATPAARGATAA
jgi:Cu2+-exporting ATPase